MTKKKKEETRNEVKQRKMLLVRRRKKCLQITECLGIFLVESVGVFRSHSASYMESPPATKISVGSLQNVIELIYKG